MAVNQVAISEAGNVQLSVEGAQETQIVLAVPGIQGPAGASASGAVEYVDLSGVSPIAVSGDPVTTSGSFEISIDESLLSIAPSQLSDGTLPSGVTVSGISLAASINDLSDVDTATVAPASGEALVWNGSEWNPGPAGAEAAGNAIGQIQYNDGTSPPGLAASSGLVWDDTSDPKVLTVGGDINLDDGGSFQTTLQLVTPTAARTITFPDATGTVGLVAGSTTEAAYASLDGGFAGAVPFAWDGSFSVDGSFGYNPTGGVLSVRDLQSITLTSPTIAGNTTFTGRLICSVAGASNAPAGFFSGAWRVSGGDSTNTKPQVYIEQGSVTSNAWSTAGTGFGVNSNSTFAGRLADLQKNATSRWHVSSEGLVVTTQPAPAAVDTTATLTVANIQTGIVTTSTAAAVDMTLPTGTLMDGGIVGVQNDMATMWSVINTGPNTATLLDGVDHTIVGAAAVAAGTSGRFVSRRTGTTTWVTYRVS
jgi:hypothetical protein